MEATKLPLQSNKHQQLLHDTEPAKPDSSNMYGASLPATWHFSADAAILAGVGLLCALTSLDLASFSVEQRDEEAFAVALDTSGCTKHMRILLPSLYSNTATVKTFLLISLALD